MSWAHERRGGEQRIPEEVAWSAARLGHVDAPPHDGQLEGAGERALQPRAQRARGGALADLVSERRVERFYRLRGAAAGVAAQVSHLLRVRAHGGAASGGYKFAVRHVGCWGGEGKDVAGGAAGEGEELAKLLLGKRVARLGDACECVVGLR